MRNYLAVILCMVSITGMTQDTIYLDIMSSIHLLFESPVQSVDVGSGKYSDGSGNIVSDITTQVSGPRLKVAPTLVHFPTTNLFVETEAAYYSFILHYSEGAKPYVYPIAPEIAIFKKERKKDTLEVKHRPTPQGICEKVVERKGQVMAGKTSQSVSYWVDGIYIDEESTRLFFHVKVHNASNIFYDWGYTGFFVRDKGNLSIKNAAVQEEEIYPTYIFREEMTQVKVNETLSKVFVFDKFTIDKRKVLSMEFWEDRGERKVIVEIRSKDLLRAERI